MTRQPLISPSSTFFLGFSAFTAGGLAVGISTSRLNELHSPSVVLPQTAPNVPQASPLPPDSTASAASVDPQTLIENGSDLPDASAIPDVSESYNNPDILSSAIDSMLAPIPIEDNLSYEMSTLGRQAAVPLADAFINATILKAEAQSNYRMTYVVRVQEPDGKMFSGWRRALFSRNTAAGQFLRAVLLPSTVVSQPLGPDLQQELWQSSAATRSRTNFLQIIPSVVRFSADALALAEMQSKPNRSQSTAEQLMISTDMLTAVAHTTDMALWSAGLANIAASKESRAASLLTWSHRGSIASNTLQIVTGGLRLYAESRRQRTTGHANYSSYFWGFLDIGNGLYQILFSSYLLKIASGEDASDPKAVLKKLLCLVDLPRRVQDPMRFMAAFGAAAGLGMNSAHLMGAYLLNVVPSQMRDQIGFSSFLCATGSGLALMGAFMMTSASYWGARVLMGLGSVFVAVQTTYELWPVILQLLSRL